MKLLVSLFKVTGVIPIKNFTWTGITKTGKRKTGNINANNLNEARNVLVHKNIIPINIKKIKKFTKKNKILDFTRQLLILLDANISLSESLLILNKTADKGLSELTHSLGNRVSKGESFSGALKEHSDLFDSFYISLIEAGEASNRLSNILSYLLKHLELITELKSTLKKSLIYPMIILFSSFTILVLMIIFVIPQFNNIYTSLNVRIPDITSALLKFSFIMKDNFFYMISILMATFLFFSINRKLRMKCKIIIFYFLSRLPFFKHILRYQFIAHWSRLLATMTQAGLPLLPCLQTSINTTYSTHDAKQIEMIIMQVTAGSSLAKSIQRTKNLFPEKVIQLLSVAENAGNLAFMFDKIANIYYENLKALLNILCKLLEPVIIIILSVFIGGLLIAMYLPIFNMNA